MAKGLPGWPWVILGARTREGCEGKFMSCVVTVERGGEKRRMESKRLFANRASVKVEAQANEGVGRVEEVAHG